MKKLISLLMALTMFVTLLPINTFAEASANETKLNIYNQGLLDHVNYDSKILSETADTYTVEYFETDGISANGLFEVTEKAS